MINHRTSVRWFVRMTRVAFDHNRTGSLKVRKGCEIYVFEIVALLRSYERSIRTKILIIESLK